jgi:hypothetical protein
MTDVETVTVNGLRYLVVILKQSEMDVLARKIAVELHKIEAAEDDDKLYADHLRGPLHDGTHPDCIVCHPVSA